MKFSQIAAAAVLALAIPVGAMAQSVCGATIFFPSGATAITAQMQQALRSVVAANPTAEITVTGFADSVGSATVNQRISAARAQNVANFIRGISPSTPIRTVQGAGEVASGGASQQARRVEVRLPGCVATAQASGGLGQLGAVGPAAAAAVAGLILIVAADSEGSTGGT